MSILDSSLNSLRSRCFGSSSVFETDSVVCFATDFLGSVSNSSLGSLRSRGFDSFSAFENSVVCFATDFLGYVSDNSLGSLRSRGFDSSSVFEKRGEYYSDRLRSPERGPPNEMILLSPAIAHLPVQCRLFERV